MEEKILEAIKDQNGKLTFKNLSKRFKIDNYQLEEILLKLKTTGRILQRGNKYEIFPDNLYLGTINVSTVGNKYLFHNGGRLPIDAVSTNNVILNDLVAYQIVDANEGKIIVDGKNNNHTDIHTLDDNEKELKYSYKKAKIVSIVDRPLGKMTCEVMLVDGIKKIVPYHREINITLPKEITDKLIPGDVILVDVSPNEIDEYADAKFIKKLKYKDEPGDKDMITALNYGFDNDYSEEELNEIYHYPTEVTEEDIKNRYDFRSQKVFTIDGANTKDMDDAISAERIDNGNSRVYVHIADVSHYIKPDSALFKRAADKTTSVYINNTVIHMLHSFISNGICSLNPNVDRLTLSFIMDIDPKGNIVDFNIIESVINSKKKMTYEEVDKILTNECIPSGYEDYVQDIYLLYDISQRLKSNFDNLDFGNFESKKTYNSDGSLKEIKDPIHSPSEELIEYLMLAAGKSAGEWLFYMDLIAVYRNHEAPNRDTLMKMIKMIVDSGFDLKSIKNVNNANDIKKLLKIFKKKKEYPVLAQIIVMAMQTAKYGIDNLGHFALLFLVYLQVTSPIRRFTDLLNHMRIKNVLSGIPLDKQYAFLDDRKTMSEYCNRASLMERQADKAAADGERRIIIEAMEEMIGQELEATVVMIDKLIKIKVMGIDTYIDQRSLGDNFVFDSTRKLFYDKTTNAYLGLGTKINICLTAANSANRDFKVMVTGIIESNVKKKILKK